jgi:protein-tyrosine phosphatase
MDQPPKILMICLGNICRSPMAEGVMRHLATSEGLSVKLDSCGTSGWHEGEKADSRAIQNLKEHGIDINDLRSRGIRHSDFDEFDYLFCMDTSNFEDVTNLAKSYAPEQTHKIKLFMDATHPGQKKIVPDPYYGGDDSFEKVYQLVSDACEKIIEDLKKG